MSPRPVIAIIGDDQDAAERCFDAVKRSDGDPLRLDPTPGEAIHETLSRISALLVCSSPREDSRGEWERGLLKAAIDIDLPVLCLSSGLHVLNVVTGGKQPQAIQDHSAQPGDGEDVSSYHHIFIAPGGKLAAIVGSGGFVRVNSRHDLGFREADKSPSLLASAYSLENGVIEALESPAHRWVIGVQFNPERFNELPPHFMRLFQSMVDRAREWQNGGENSQEK